MVKALAREPTCTQLRRERDFEAEKSMLKKVF